MAVETCPSFDGLSRRSNPGIDRAPQLWIASRSLAMTIVTQSALSLPEAQGTVDKETDYR
jgi:hypothetical protein